MSTHAFANTIGPDLYFTGSRGLKRYFRFSKHYIGHRNKAILLLKMFIFFTTLLADLTIVGNKLSDVWYFIKEFMLSTPGLLVIASVTVIVWIYDYIKFL